MRTGPDPSEWLMIAAFAISVFTWSSGAVALLISSWRERPGGQNCLLASVLWVAGTALLFCGTISIFAEALVFVVADPHHSVARALASPWSAALVVPASLSLFHLRRHEPFLYGLIEAGGALAAIAATIVAPGPALYAVVAVLVASHLLARGFDTLVTRYRISRATRPSGPSTPEARPRVVVHDFTSAEIIILPRADLHRASQQAG